MPSPRQRELSVLRQLRHQRQAHRARQRIDDAITQAELVDDADRPYRNYSAGMRQRLCFARALLGRPDLLLLDEATSGLDPGLKQSFRRRVRDIAASGVAILYATHDLDEARDLCTRVALLVKSRIVAQGAWADVEPQARAVFRLEDP